MTSISWRSAPANLTRPVEADRDPVAAVRHRTRWVDRLAGRVAAVVTRGAAPTLLAMLTLPGAAAVVRPGPRSTATVGTAGAHADRDAVIALVVCTVTVGLIIGAVVVCIGCARRDVETPPDAPHKEADPPSGPAKTWVVVALPDDSVAAAFEITREAAHEPLAPLPHEGVPRQAFSE